MKRIIEIDRINRLKNLAVFTDRIPDEIRADASFWTADPGDEIIRTEAAPDTMYLLLSGRAVLRLLLPNGRYILPGTLRSPSFIGEMEMLGFEGDAINVRAVEKCTLAAFSYTVCRKYLLNDPVFLRRLCLEISRKERDKIFSLARTQGYPLPNRLAQFILETSESDRYRVRKIDAAESLGVTYRRLSQVLSDFEQKEMIQKDGKCFIIKNILELTRLAQELQIQ